MQKSIHDILKKAGVAKGISVEEVLTILALKNGDIMKDFDEGLQKYVADGSLPESIYQKAMLDLENASESLRSIEKKYVDTVSFAYRDAFIRVSEDYLQKKQNKFALLEKQFTALLS